MRDCCSQLFSGAMVLPSGWHVRQALRRAAQLGVAVMLASLLPQATLAESAPLAAAAPVLTVAVVYRDIPNLISAEGVVEAVRQSTLAAQVQGQIIELRVKVGDSVNVGQVLMRIDSRAAEQVVSGSQSQLAEAQAGLTNALRVLERNRQLFAQKFISKAALDQAEADYKAAQARVGSIQANVGQAATARTFTTITAPYSGTVSATLLEVGDMATPGRPLISLFDPAHMRVIATLSQSSMREVNLDLPAQIDVPALQRTMTTKHVTLVPIADSRTHTAKLRLDVDNASGLLPGQFARAYFPTSVSRKLVIPLSAVLHRSEVTAVYVQSTNGSMQLRQIRTGDLPVGDLIEVLAGLREGEQIATDPISAGLISATHPAATFKK